MELKIPFHFSLQEHGDPLERKFSSFINSQLSYYEKLWTDFIGNDGNSRMPKLPDLDQKIQQTRSKINHLAYSALESALCISPYFDEEYLKSEFKSCTAEQRLLFVTDKLISFYAHVGRVCDLIKKLGDEIHDGDLYKNLDDFYQQRNIILHEIRPFIFKIADDILITVPEGKNLGFNELQKWNKLNFWDDANNLEVDKLSSLLSETARKLFNELNGAFARLYDKLIAGPYSEISRLLKLIDPPTPPISHVGSGSKCL